MENISKKQLIFNEISNDIKNMKYNIGDRLPSENELALDYSVSRMTAREALTNIVTTGFANRIHGKGTFVKSNNPYKKEVVLMLPGLATPESDFYFYFLSNNSKTLSKTEATCRKYNLNLRIIFSDFNPEVEKHNLKELIVHKPDALIIDIIGEYTNAHLLKTLKDLDVFTVMIDSYDKDQCNAFSVSDNYNGTFEMLEEMYKKDCKIIEYYTYDRETSSILDRNRAYTDFAKKYGFYDKKLIHKVPYNIEGDMQYIVRDYILNKSIDHNISDSALFATSSTFMGYFYAMEQKNIALNKKIYASVDRVPENAPKDINILILEQNFEEIAEKAVEIINAHFSDTKTNNNVFVPTKLIDTAN